MNSSFKYKIPATVAVALTAVSVLFLSVMQFAMSAQAQTVVGLIQTTYNSIEISWFPGDAAAVGHEVRYREARTSDNNFTSLGVDVREAGTGVIVSISNLTPQTSYEVEARHIYERVRGHKTFGNWYSLALTSTLSLPLAPIVSSASETINSVSLMWHQPSSGPQLGYRLRYREQGSGGEYTTSNVSVTLTDTQVYASITGLQAQTTYNVQVQHLYEGSALGPWLDLISVTTISPTAPRTPTFNSGAGVRFMLQENTSSVAPVGNPLTVSTSNSRTLHFSLSGEDAQNFDINSDGQILAKESVTYDYETQHEYSFEAHVSDGYPNNNADDTIRVLIILENIDEPGVLSVSRAMPPVQGRTITAQITDPDGGITNQRWVWKRFHSETGFWSVVKGQSSGNVSTYTPTSEDLGHSLLVEIYYDDAQGPGKGLAQKFARTTNN